MIHKNRIAFAICLFLTAGIVCCAGVSERKKETIRLERDNYLQLKTDPHLQFTRRLRAETRILVESDYPSALKQEYSLSRTRSGIDLSRFENRVVRIVFSEEPPTDAAFIEQYKSAEQPMDLEPFRKRHQHDNVLVIVFDALNPTHLGCYGYSRRTSPVIDHIASESMVWDRAFALAPYTLASTGALLTGLHPIVHGVLGEGNKLP